jgi:tetratricopeptide (TPR) repeat protein
MRFGLRRPRFLFAMAVMGNSATLTSPRPHRDYLAWLMIFASVVLVYAPALNGSLLWDDNGHICPKTLRSLHGLLRIWTDLGATQQYYPILHSTFWVEYRLWGETVLGYHLANLVLHCIASCFVISLMRQLALPGAWLGGLIFALHPVCVESVAWMSEQKNTLSTVFCLGAALAYLRFHQSRRATIYSLALILFLLALLTKSVTAMLPAVLLVIIWWQQGRLRWKEDFLPLIPWLAIGAVAGLFTAWVERTYIGAQGSDFILTLGQRGLLAGRIPCFYFWKMVWPANLIFIYPRWTPDPAEAWQYVFPVAVIGLLGAVWVVRKWNRGPLAALFAFLALLFPVLGFVNVYPFVFSFVADHFQYLASLALIIPASATLTSIVQRCTTTSTRWTASLAALVLLAILGTSTWKQSHLYRNAETLYRDIIARNPGCWLAYNNLGNVLDTSPEHTDEVIALYQTALRLKPDHPEAHINLASILAKNPATKADAIRHWETALHTRPDFADGHNNLGVLLAREPNRLPEAIAHFEVAVRLDPAFSAAHSNLGTALARIPGRLPDAIRHYEAALNLDPDSAEAHFNLANALAKSPNTHSEAIHHYETALQLSPEYADAHCNLAALLSQIPERRAEAISHYETALRQHPEWDFAQRALDRLRSTLP